MTDFNLEQFKAGRIALTRDGRETRYLGTLLCHLYPLVAAVNYSENFECVESFTLDGEWYATEEFVGLHRMDLVKMKPEKKKLYIAVWNEDVDGNHSTSAGFSKRNSLLESYRCQPSDEYQIVEVEIEV